MAIQTKQILMTVAVALMGSQSFAGGTVGSATLEQFTVCYEGGSKAVIKMQEDSLLFNMDGAVEKIPYEYGNPTLASDDETRKASDALKQANVSIDRIYHLKIKNTDGGGPTTTMTLVKSNNHNDVLVVGGMFLASGSNCK